MTIAQLKAAEPVLVRLSNEKMAPYAAFKMSEFLQAASEELKKFDDVRNELVLKYGEDTSQEKTDGSVRVKPENMDAFKAEIEPLLQQEVELGYINTNTIMAFDITPTEAILLRPFIDPAELE
jgi:hypothetical protein